MKIKYLLTVTGFNLCDVILYKMKQYRIQIQGLTIHFSNITKDFYISSFANIKFENFYLEMALAH